MKKAVLFSSTVFRIAASLARQNGGCVSVMLVVLLFASSPAFAQLNFIGFGASDPTDPVSFVAGLGTNALPLTPLNGVGPFLFQYASTPIPGFSVVNWPDIPEGFPAGAGGLVGLALSGSHSTMIRMKDLGTNQEVTKQVNLQVTTVDFTMSTGPRPSALSGAGVGDSVQIPVWAQGGTPPYTFVMDNANLPLPPGGSLGLPSGLSLNTTDPNAGLASIDGNINPGAAGGPYNFGIRVTDVNLKTFRRTFTNIFISGLHLNSFSGYPERFLPLANRNQPYSQTLTATGCSGSCSFSLVQGDTLPAGLSMSSTGAITGIPTQVTYGRNVTVVVSDGTGQSMRRRLVIMVLPPIIQPLTILPNFNIPDIDRDFPAGTLRPQWFYATGGQPPYTFSLDEHSDALPSGVYPKIATAASQGPEGDPQVGMLWSRALVPGIYPFVLKVTDASGTTATQSFSLEISAIGTLYGALPAGSNIPTRTKEYRQSVFPVGGTPPYSVNTINIAPGLRIADDGLVTGTPLAAGVNELDFQLTDSSIPPKTYFNNASITISDFIPVQDGVLGTSGGTVNDGTTTASVQFPAGALPGNTEVAIDVLPTAPNLATPIGFSAETFFTNIQLSPTPPMPFPPGVNLVLPLPAPGLPAGTPLQLFRFDTVSGLLVTAFDTNGVPLVGNVLPGGVSARFENVARLSTVVGFRPNDVTPPVVTPPGSISISATEAGGARGSASSALAFFLTAGTATDDLDAAPVRLPPQVSGNDVDNNTLFSVGTTTVVFRFRDATGKIGTATSQVTVLASLRLISAKVWVGLKNSDDQGTSFDLRTEVYKGSTLLSTAETRCVMGITRNSNSAKQVEILFATFVPVGLSSGDVVSIKILTRIGTNSNGTQCPGHNNAVGLRLYYDNVQQQSSFNGQIAPNPLQDFFLHSSTTGDFFDTTSPTSSNSKFKDSPAVNFSGGNSWKEIGTWRRTIQ